MVKDMLDADIHIVSVKYSRSWYPLKFPYQNVALYTILYSGNTG